MATKSVWFAFNSHPVSQNIFCRVVLMQLPRVLDMTSTTPWWLQGTTPPRQTLSALSFPALKPSHAFHARSIRETQRSSHMFVFISMSFSQHHVMARPAELDCIAAI
jgi:hypothetical protein